MARIRTDLQTGTIAVDLDAGDLSITFSAVPDFPTLAPGDFVALTLVDFADIPSSEIVHLTAYTAGDLTGTIARAQEGPAPASAWPAGTRWDNAPTAEELDDLETQIEANADAHCLTLALDGQGVVITTGAKIMTSVEVPTAMDLTRTTVLADVAGSIVLDVFRSTFAGWPAGASIIGAGTNPSLAGAQKGQLVDLSDWDDTSLDAGDLVWLVVEGTPATLTAVKLLLFGTVT